MSDTIIIQDSIRRASQVGPKTSVHAHNNAYIRAMMQRILVCALVGLMIFFGIAYVVIQGAPKPPAAKNVSEPVVTNAPPILLQLDTVSVNTTNLDHYVKAKITVSLASHEDRDRLEHDSFKVKDRMITIFSGKSIEYLQSVKGQGILNTEIRDDLNSFLKHEGVKTVYFTDFLFQ